jgi:hypothetical protein
VPSGTGLTSSYDNVDRTLYTTASISPTASRWLVVDSCGRAATDPGAPTISGLSLSWTQEASLLSTGASPPRLARHYAWTGVAPGSGAITISWGATTSIGTAWHVYELSADVDTSDPFVQTVTSAPGTAGTGITISLAAFGSTDNRPLIAAYHGANETSTVEAGYTEIGNVFGTAGNLSWATAYHGTTADTTPSYSWVANTSERAAIGSEIKAAPAGAVVIRRTLLGVGL